MVCVNCGSDNVNVQLVHEVKKRNILVRILFFIIKCFLFVFSLFWWLLSVFFPVKRKTKTQGYAVCQSCGYSWPLNKKTIKNNHKKRLEG